MSYMQSLLAERQKKNYTDPTTMTMYQNDIVQSDLTPFDYLGRDDSVCTVSFQIDHCTPI